MYVATSWQGYPFCLDGFGVADIIDDWYNMINNIIALSVFHLLNISPKYIFTDPLTYVQ